MVKEMDRLDAQFYILKRMNNMHEIPQSVVDKVVRELEDEVDRLKIEDWISENRIKVVAMFKGAWGGESDKVVALVRNRDNDKNLAVLGHDPTSGRVVGRIKDDVLQKLFDRYIDQSIIVYVAEPINGSRVMRRRKVVPTDEDYLKHLLSRFVIVPYDVRWMKRLPGSGRLDGLVDDIYSEEVMVDGV